MANAFDRIVAVLFVVLFPAVSLAEPLTTIRSNGPAANRVDIIVVGDGYTAAEIAGGLYAQHVENAIGGFFAQQPYAEYQRFFNVHRIDVTSLESGSDHPSRGIFRNTALNTTYDCANITRLICADTNAVNAVLTRTSVGPNAREIVLVLVNDPEYGGSGGAVSVASIHPAVVELVLHEVGHSFAQLADEYGGNTGPTCTLVEPSSVNSTMATTRAAAKWATWIDPSTPIPTTAPVAGVPGLYQGSSYCDFGMYRPTHNSKMRSLGVPFEQINVEQHVKRIYNFVNPIDSATPAAASARVRQGQAIAFSVTAVAPVVHAQSITWSVDGTAVAVGPQFLMNGGAFSIGVHTVSVTVVDPTPWVRNDPAGVLRASRSWSVAVTSSHPLPAEFAGDGTESVAVFRPSAGRLFINGGATVEWGLAGDLPVQGDYNGDGRVEFAVWRPATGTWYIPGMSPIVWGRAGDQPIPTDYDGDGITDIAVWRPSTGEWFIRNRPVVVWGRAADMPVPADYNGDGRADIAVWRPASGTWYVMNMATHVWGVAGDIPVPADYDGNGRADLAVFRRATGHWYVKDQFTELWGAAGDLPVALDRSGDGRSELAVYRMATGTWYIRNRTTGANETVVWGAAGDIPIGVRLAALLPAAADMDGDGRTDLTVFRASTGAWLSLLSSTDSTAYTNRSWGLSGDVPVTGDYDGDGRSDPAVFRPSNGTWYALRSSTGYADYLSRTWGQTGDTPVPADYDGDGRTDFAVYRPSLGRWFLFLSTTASPVVVDFGLATDTPVPADYDGDRRADIAIFRPSTGDWYVLNRFTGAFTTMSWGLSGDRPVPADYDGDLKADLAVFRPSSGRWVILLTSTGNTTYALHDFGLSADTAVPADYDGDGRADIAVFRPSTGRWYVLNRFLATYTFRDWGLAGDLAANPVPF